MAVPQGDAYLAAYLEIVNPDQPRKYKVKRK
jgi:hypothetical protein